ncbi:DUF3775 domain-containing protein [Hoeflea poritis]|uniref:DUF3775 domain-containing protein n=1 Tax=Hoeflea poritis TaxID=2993659 RepID=A0ABT4VJI3_9HYPH|nr:DUF3775 domain-containing protein [Hoeflea poritis]MDA4844859.1 DUF3775 domain-containing protein [Hoeflea poritis]
MLEISTEKVCFTIIKARAFDVKDAVTDPDPGSNASDDAMYAVLESHRDDPVEEELTSFISSLTVDEQIDLVALAWLGRDDDYDRNDWDDIRAQATDASNDRTAQYLLGMPMLADYLEEGLSELGLSCDEFEFSHL